jgi:hypothetical protein
VKAVRAFALQALPALALAACTPAPMPTPEAGQAPMQDAMAPADVASSASAPSPALPSALPPPDMAPAEPVANDLGTATADRWVGTWQGPEGTSLRIAKQEVGYQLVIANLDGPREFHAIAAGDLLQFERDGKTETLHAGDGKATGMKWLADKRDCLVVSPGEGYCRE